jgi:hypothetical protein
VAIKKKNESVTILYGRCNVKHLSSYNFFCSLLLYFHLSPFSLSFHYGTNCSGIIWLKYGKNSFMCFIKAIECSIIHVELFSYTWGTTKVFSTAFRINIQRRILINFFKALSFSMNELMHSKKKVFETVLTAFFCETTNDSFWSSSYFVVVDKLNSM